MRRAIFESNLPGWLSQAEQSRRIALWRSAGFDTVILQVDAATGACWPSAILPKDSRVDLANDPLRWDVDAYHAAGLSVVLDFSCGLFAPYVNPQIKPEYVSPALAGFYDYWNADFLAWKSDCIAECAAYVDADAVALDYLRTGRDPQADEASSASVVLDFIQQVRAKIDQSYPLMSMTNAVYATSQREGVDIAGWLASSAVDAACLFNYSYPYPVQYAAGLDPSRVWLISGNYDMMNGQVVKRPGLSVAKDWRQIARQANPSALGQYLSNQLTDDQAKHIAYTARML